MEIILFDMAIVLSCVSILVPRDELTPQPYLTQRVKHGDLIPIDRLANHVLSHAEVPRLQERRPWNVAYDLEEHKTEGNTTAHPVTTTIASFKCAPPMAPSPWSIIFSGDS